MRILLATETFLPRVSGITIHVDMLARGLRERGHQVAVIAPSPNHKAFSEVMNGYTVYRIPSIKSPWQKHSRVAIQQYPQVAEAVRDFRPDVAHIHSPMGVPSWVLAGARWQHYPVVATHHFSIDFILRYLKPLALLHPVTKRVLISFLNRLYRRCAVLISPTENFKQALIDFGIRVPITVLSNGVDTGKLISGSWPRKHQVMYISRLASEKNLTLLIAVVDLVLRADSTVTFLICGDGDKKKYLQQELSAWSDRVIFTGGLVPGSEALWRAYAESKVMVSTSLVETQGLTVLESLACATPVVAARGGAVVEAVRQGETGYLVDPTNVTEFRDRILQLLNDPKKARIMGETGRQLILKEHSFSQTVEALEKIYENL